MTKMTYAIAIDNAINGNITEEVREKLEALKTQLAKRNSGERKPTKTQRENEGLKEDIWAFVSENGAKRAGDVAGYFGISGQKASALLKQLVDAERLERFTEKRVTYFRVAEGM
jgi:predicted HTH transcriptional regulator